MYTTNEIREMLALRSADQELLFSEARRIRQSAFGDRVILRGVIEITNLCRVNCDYCPMRRDNTSANKTYFIKSDELSKSVSDIKRENINVVFLQGGEIPQTTQVVLKVIPQILELYQGNVEILLCLGIKSEAEYAELKQRGATSYILKHETSDAVLHERLRHESLGDRLGAIEVLLELGYKVGTGTIVGLPGQTINSIADDIVMARKMGVHMASASPFVPASGTPLADASAGSVDMTLNTLAAMRLAEPRWLIPSVSALEQRGRGGQLAGLQAGANVLTCNFTPATQRSQYLIYGPTRYIVRSGHVRSILRESGLSPSGSIWAASSARPATSAHY